MSDKQANNTFNCISGQMLQVQNCTIKDKNFDSVRTTSSYMLSLWVDTKALLQREIRSTWKIMRHYGLSA